MNDLSKISSDNGEKKGIFKQQIPQLNWLVMAFFFYAFLLAPGFLKFLLLQTNVWVAIIVNLIIVIWFIYQGVKIVKKHKK